MAFEDDDLEKFARAIQSMKLYRRAELEGSQGEDLIEKLYVDPLPSEHVHKVLRAPNTTFLIGRKGTGKSTVFLRAQKSLLKDKDVISTYVDIKTVFESAQVDPGLVSELGSLGNALPEDALKRLFLMTAFLKAVVAGVRDDLKKQLSGSFKRKLKEVFTGSYEDLYAQLDAFVSELQKPSFVEVAGLRTPSLTNREKASAEQDAGASLGVGAEGVPTAQISATRADVAEFETSTSYSEILLRVVDLRELIDALKNILEPLGVRRLYVFLDDFSELPADAMKTVVDVLVAPLNNWSNELVKFKVAAYPGRIYYGALDKSKIDEISLDLHSLYGQATVADMEIKGVEFTRRLIETRLAYFDLESGQFFEKRNEEQVWMALFQAALGNPRTLGYILYFAYESHLIYGRRIGVSAVHDAAKRYYEDKLEPYFAMGAFLHEAFEERSTVFSLKELLEALVNRAKVLRSKEASSIFRKIDGQHPTSHFNVDPTFDALLSTLELNFFVTKYYVMSNRDGRRVAVYALNYGLCEKYSITFGRPTGSREQRLYFVERVFDYNPIFQSFIASNQEIRCDNCERVFEAEDLNSLKMFGMMCPACKSGTCTVTNISKKYESVIRSVDSAQLLPATELGILQTLNSEGRPLYAGDIAGEMDVSYQLIGKRAKMLDEQRLVDREYVRGRRELSLSDGARRIYFDRSEAWGLQLSVDDSPEDA